MRSGNCIQCDTIWYAVCYAKGRLEKNKFSSNLAEKLLGNGYFLCRELVIHCFFLGAEQIWIKR